VRTGPGLRAKNAVEARLLEKLPGYTLLRGLAGRVTGKADPALRRRSPRSKRHWSGSDCRETGGRLLYCAGSVCADADGRSDLHPAARTGSSGHVPFTAALKVFLKWGAGAG
jgi:hypothetical protein